jgi:hypothetical protein
MLMVKAAIYGFISVEQAGMMTILDVQSANEETARTVQSLPIS